jgi:hypothetical protein
VLIACACAVGLLVLIGIGAAVAGGGDDKPAAAATPSPTHAAPGPSLRRVPQLTAAQQRQYLAALAKIEPALVANRERAIRRGRNICDYGLNHRGGRQTLTAYTVRELSGGDAQITAAQARQVIRAVKVWCR